jgi:hypothetical protein
MRTHGVVMPTPAFHDDPGLFERVEDLAVEEFVAQASIEALDVAILPWASGCDVGSLRPDGGDPVLRGRSMEDEKGSRENPPLNLKVHQANQRGRHQLSVGDVYSGPLIQNPEQYQVSDPRTDHGCQIEEHDTFMRLDATKHIAFLQPVVR